MRACENEFKQLPQQTSRVHSRIPGTGILFPSELHGNEDIHEMHL